MHTTTPELDPARNLVAKYLESVTTFCEFNHSIESLLGVNWAEVTDNGADTPLPGANISEVRGHLGF